MRARFISHPAITALVLLLSLTPGCTSLSKGMSDQPTDQDHGSRTFGAFVEAGKIKGKGAGNLARASAELEESRVV